VAQFKTEEEIFGGAAGEKPGSEAAYHRELARHRFLMELQRGVYQKQLDLQRQSNAAAEAASDEQTRIQRQMMEEQREFSTRSLAIQEQMRKTAEDQGRSARLQALMAAIAVVLSAAAIFVTVALPRDPVIVTQPTTQAVVPN
jgi:Flp pilus assembly protein TadB